LLNIKMVIEEPKPIEVVEDSEVINTMIGARKETTSEEEDGEISRVMVEDVERTEVILLEEAIELGREDHNDLNELYELIK